MVRKDRKVILENQVLWDPVDQSVHLEEQENEDAPVLMGHVVLPVFLDQKVNVVTLECLDYLAPKVKWEHPVLLDREDRQEMEEIRENQAHRGM